MRQDTADAMKKIKQACSIIEECMWTKSILILLKDTTSIPIPHITYDGNLLILEIRLNTDTNEQDKLLQDYLRSFACKSEKYEHILENVKNQLIEELVKHIESIEWHNKYAISQLPDHNILEELIEHFEMKSENIKTDDTITIKKSTSRDRVSGPIEEPERITNDS